MFKGKPWGRLILIILVTALAGYIVWPGSPDIQIGKFRQELKIHQGLDLAGGTHLVYQANLGDLKGRDANQAMASLRDVIERRINGLGVSEPVIQTGRIGDKATLIVELPGISDIEKAKGLIGQTAQLKFATNLTLGADGQIDVPAENLVLTGQDLKHASVSFDQQTGLPNIQLEFNDSGREKFATATKNSIGKEIYILLDRQIISAPTVQQEIPNGQAVINGQFTIPQAKELVALLNGGALPVGIELIEQRNIGATLGDESIKNSLVAGTIGLLAVAIFMIIQYGRAGLMSVLALIVYTLVLMALFILIPVTITLAGIAGFILSIGMAVDANILIFERMKEERAAGKSEAMVLESGFHRAWSSIRDSNLSSLITAGILLWFGSGLIRGFAFTLALGIIVSLFSAITVTKTLLAMTLGQRKQGSRR